MTLLPGDVVPDFQADTTVGPISFHDWIGNDWVFFFSHPVDFTPVCTTEMGRTSRLSAEFDRRGVKPIGLSTDSVHEHLKWITDVNDTQNTTLRFSIVADPDLKISCLYDMIHPAQSETAAVRAVFIIDSGKKLRLMMTYPMNVGRNFDEILRVIDALQTADRHGIATPADWRPGGDVISRPRLTTGWRRDCSRRAGQPTAPICARPVSMTELRLPCPLPRRQRRMRRAVITVPAPTALQFRLRQALHVQPLLWLRRPSYARLI